MSLNTWKFLVENVSTNNKDLLLCQNEKLSIPVSKTNVCFTQGSITLPITIQAIIGNSIVNVAQASPHPTLISYNTIIQITKHFPRKYNNNGNILKYCTWNKSLTNDMTCSMDIKQKSTIKLCYFMDNIDTISISLYDIMKEELHHWKQCKMTLHALYNVKNNHFSTKTIARLYPVILCKTAQYWDCINNSF